MSKILCKIFGHRWRWFGRRDYQSHSMVIDWLCDRCEKQDTQQWDT